MCTEAQWYLCSHVFQDCLFGVAVYAGVKCMYLPFPVDVQEGF